MEVLKAPETSSNNIRQNQIWSRIALWLAVEDLE